MTDEEFGRAYSAWRGWPPPHWSGMAWWVYGRDLVCGPVWVELLDGHPSPPDGCDEPLQYESEDTAYAAIGRAVRYIQAKVPPMPEQSGWKS